MFRAEAGLQCRSRQASRSLPPPNMEATFWGCDTSRALTWALFAEGSNESKTVDLCPRYLRSLFALPTSYGSVSSLFIGDNCDKLTTEKVGSGQHSAAAPNSVPLNYFLALSLPLNNISWLSPCPLLASCSQPIHGAAANTRRPHLFDGLHNTLGAGVSVTFLGKPALFGPLPLSLGDNESGGR